MGNFADSFNRSGLSRFLNRPAGRLFRLTMGVVFLALGYAYRGHVLGVASMVWGLLGFSAGAFDICFLSALLGGPISGPKIRARYKVS